MPASNILWEWLGNMHPLERREVQFASGKSQEFLGIGVEWGEVGCDPIRKVLLETLILLYIFLNIASNSYLNINRLTYLRTNLG